MNNNLLIPIFSGILTLFASFFIAMYKSRVEIKKIAKQLEEKYTIALYNKRLEVFPEMFKIVNTLCQKIEKGINKFDDLIQFQESFDCWLSNNGILLTKSMVNLLWPYHNYLIIKLEKTNELTFSEEDWKHIRNFHVKICQSIRAELGIFETKAAGQYRLDHPDFKNMFNRIEQTSELLIKRFR